MNKKNIILSILALIFLSVAAIVIYLRLNNKNLPQVVSQFYPMGIERFKPGNMMGKIEKNNTAAGLFVDSNGDGINDEKAKMLGLNPYKTDNDGDGIFDIDEIKLTKTDPLKADTDGDGLNDLDEINKYRTDPLKADTDGDGNDDGLEVKNGFNPNGPGKLETAKK